MAGLNVERGTVVGPAAGGRVYVEVPKLGKGYRFNCQIALQFPPGTLTGPGGAEPHQHSLPTAVPLPAGTRVIVAPISGVPDDLVVIGVTA